MLIPARFVLKDQSEVPVNDDSANKTAYQIQVFSVIRHANAVI